MLIYILVFVGGIILTLFGVKNEAVRGLLNNLKTKEEDVTLKSEQLSNNIKIDNLNLDEATKASQLKQELAKQNDLSIKDKEKFWNDQK